MPLTRAFVLALTAMLASCANENDGPSKKSEMVVVGRVIATRQVSLMIGDVELGTLIYTLDSENPRSSPLYFVVADVDTGCPRQFSKADFYRIALERVRVNYLIDETPEQEKQEHWADLKATNCTLVANPK